MSGAAGMKDFVIKICGITRREDAEAAVEAGATALGFVFYAKSPRVVSPEVAAALGLGLDAWKVGIFVNETAPRVEQVMRAAKLDVAQIYGSDAPAGARIWRAFRVETDFDARLAEGAEAVLLDGQSNGVSFDWSIALGAADAAKVIVAGGLDASNVAEAIRIARPWGVDSSSKLEIEPGIKDHGKVRAFIAAAKSAAKEYVC